MNNALGYFTMTTYINPTLQCSGAYYSQSFAVGVCIANAAASSMYSYDGVQVTWNIFSTTTCSGTVTSQTIYQLNQCNYSASTNAANPNGFYTQYSYAAALPTNTAPGVDSM